MRILKFIPDAQTRSRVQALAEARPLPVRQDGPWMIFEAVNDPEAPLNTLKAVGVPTPGLEEAPASKGASFPRSYPARRRS